MLHPLLYTSLRLSPLRPYQNAVLARMIHPNIEYGNPTPRWFIQLPRSKSTSTSSADTSEDPTEKQSTAEKESSVDNDPRIIFGETEFKTVREKYNMPKYVCPL